MSENKEFRFSPLVHSEDYDFFLRGSTFEETPIDLIGHSLEQPNYETVAILKGNTVERINGVKTPVTRNIRPEIQTGQSMDVGLQEGAVVSRLSYLAEVAGNVRRDLALVYDCDDDTRYHHFIMHPNAMFSRPQNTSKIVGMGGDSNLITKKVTFSLETKREYWKLGIYEQSATPNDTALYTVGISLGDCVGTTRRNFVGHVAGAPSEVGQPAFSATTTTRFGTLVAGTNGVPNDHIITGSVRRGNVVIAVHTDDADLSTATAGGVQYSSDGGATFADATITGSPALFAVTYGAGYYVAVGAGGGIFRSVNGLTWETVSNSLGASADLYGIDYDAGSQYFYIVGHDGTNSLVARMRDTSVVDITATVGADSDTNVLYAVRALDPGHVAIGGAGGSYYENSDIKGNAEWYSGNVQGTTSDIRVILGDSNRTVVGAGSNIYIRDWLTKNIYAVQAPESGSTITGDYLGGAEGENSVFFDNFVLVTDAGEVVILRGFHPDA